MGTKVLKLKITYRFSVWEGKKKKRKIKENINFEKNLKKRNADKTIEKKKRKNLKKWKKRKRNCNKSGSYFSFFVLQLFLETVKKC